MDALATPVTMDFHGDANLRTMLDALDRTGAVELAIVYADGARVGRGYHVTEVKAGSFVTIDCGGNPDQWFETILQIEDLPLGGERPMTAAKFRSILGKVAERIGLVGDARVTLEVGPPGRPMQTFDVGSFEAAGEMAVLHLVARAAICKPRHRAEQARSACEPTARCCA